MTTHKTTTSKEFPFNLKNLNSLNVNPAANVSTNPPYSPTYLEYKYLTSQQVVITVDSQVVSDYPLYQIPTGYTLFITNVFLSSNQLNPGISSGSALYITIDGTINTGQMIGSTHTFRDFASYGQIPLEYHAATFTASYPYPIQVDSDKILMVTGPGISTDLVINGFLVKKD
jgi:hypothetical protein